MASENAIPDPFLTALVRGKPSLNALTVLEKIGIVFEEGASVRYNSLTHQLEVTNSKAKLELLEVFLGLLDDDRQRQISVLFELIEVDYAEFSDWLFEHRIDTDGTPLRRWAQEKICNGRAAIIDTAVVTVRSGARAKTKSASQYLYPTSYLPAEVPEKLTLNEGAEAPTTAIHMTAIEGRNVGLTLEVDAVLGADNISINLNLAPELVLLDGHTSWPNDEVDAENQARVPIFHTMKITTQVEVIDGGYALLGTVRPRKTSVKGIDEPIVLGVVRGDVSVVPWPRPKKQSRADAAGEGGEK